MVTQEELSACRNAFVKDANDGQLLSGKLLVHLTVWSIFFALAVFGGLVS